MADFVQFARNELGATAIEYAFIAVLIAVTIIVAVTAVGNNLDAAFANMSAQIEGIAGEDAVGGAGGEDGDGDEEDGEEDGEEED